MNDFKTVNWYKNRKGHILHIETELGIVNIRTCLHDTEGNLVDSIELLPSYDVKIDPPIHNMRFIRKEE